ncbi:hypothetical protein BY996DRAFT_728076 [Phakopsora pachyrhizi]|nr:hypothetical protein BY996DRAFT_728076 [Phakopsora pachyrhizi]
MVLSLRRFLMKGDESIVVNPDGECQGRRGLMDSEELGYLKTSSNTDQQQPSTTPSPSPSSTGDRQQQSDDQSTRTGCNPNLSENGNRFGTIPPPIWSWNHRGTATTIAQPIRLFDSTRANRTKAYSATIRFLCSPAHLMIQLIKITSLPFMVSELIHQKHQHQKTRASSTHQETPQDLNQPQSKISSRSFSSTLHNPLRSILHLQKTNLAHKRNSYPCKCSRSISSKPHSRKPTAAPTTSIFHRILRKQDHISELIESLNRYYETNPRIRLRPRTVDRMFLSLREHFSLELMPPSIERETLAGSVAWRGQALAHIVHRWRLRKNYDISQRQSQTADLPIVSFEPPSSDDLDQPTRNKLSIINRRREKLLDRLELSCDCQIPRLKRDIQIEIVGRIEKKTDLCRFIEHFQSNHPSSISSLTYLRLVDLFRKARRWDLAVIFVDRARDIQKLGNKKLENRRTGQVTTLLGYLRDDGLIKAETDPVRLWCVNVVCEALERRLRGSGNEWIRVNRLTLDVLTKFGSMRVGDPTKGSTNQKNDELEKDQIRMLDLERHSKLVELINSSKNCIEFAIKTRERCEKLLSKLIKQAVSDQPSLWTNSSSTQLRLLEYCSRKSTEKEFIELLKVHLSQHSSGLKLSKIVLIASRRFPTLKAYSEKLFKNFTNQILEDDRKVGAKTCRLKDLRPLIDYLIRNDHDIEQIERNFEYCLDYILKIKSKNLGADEDQRKLISHLIYRCSQLRWTRFGNRIRKMMIFYYKNDGENENFGDKDCMNRNIRFSEMFWNRLGYCKRKKLRLGKLNYLRRNDRLNNKMIRSLIYLNLNQRVEHKEQLDIELDNKAYSRRRVDKSKKRRHLTIGLKRKLKLKRLIKFLNQELFELDPGIWKSIIQTDKVLQKGTNSNHLCESNEKGEKKKMSLKMILKKVFFKRNITGFEKVLKDYYRGRRGVEGEFEKGRFSKECIRKDEGQNVKLNEIEMRTTKRRGLIDSNQRRRGGFKKELASFIVNCDEDLYFLKQQ